MTANQINRTVQALKVTKAQLENELKYMPQHQNFEYIADLRDHITKLESMLSNAWTDISAQH